MCKPVQGNGATRVGSMLQKAAVQLVCSVMSIFLSLLIITDELAIMSTVL